jgi:hypothetical protein
LVVATADHRTVIAARAKSAPATVLDGIETDASLVIVRRDLSGKILNHFTRDATYLRVDGQALTP